MQMNMRNSWFEKSYFYRKYRVSLAAKQLSCELGGLADENRARSDIVCGSLDDKSQNAVQIAGFI